MAFLKGDSEPITALITAAGVAAVSVIRVSGKDVLSKVRCLFSGLPNQLVSHKIYLTFFLDFKNKDKVDQVLVSYFSSGHSFTGEEVLEINCHGSSVIVGSILKNLNLAGVRLADKGEFTYRAFLNGKLDLTQAEGLLQLIHSKSENSRRQALRHLEGKFKNEVEEIESDLTWSLAHIEANIDFSTEAISVASDREVIAKLKTVSQKILLMIKSATSGAILKDGLRVLIIGQPNVGKSSLMNFVSKSDRSLVSSVAGTTRDYIDCRVNVDGFLVNLFDTAGIHSTENEIEIEGIKRTQALIKTADLFFIVYDLSVPIKNWNAEFLNLTEGKRTIILLNKSDLVGLNGKSAFLDFCNTYNLTSSNYEVIEVNTVDEIHRERIVSCLSKVLSDLMVQDESVILSQRQGEALSSSLQVVSQVLEDLEKGTGSELIAFDLKEALVLIQQILGKHFDDQILDKVFKEFCLGK